MNDGEKSPSLDNTKSFTKKKRNRGSCMNKFMFREIIHKGEKLIEFKRLFCNRWTCPVCGNMKRRKLRDSVVEAASENDLTRFMTLTLQPGSADPYREIKAVWSKFRVYLKRKFRVSPRYFWIIELNRSGTPHLHVIIDRYIPQRWLCAKWQAVGGGRIVHVKSVDDISDSVDYMLKSITFSGEYELPRGTVRYGYSKGLLKESVAIKSDWKSLPSTVRLERIISVGDVLHEKYDDSHCLISFVKIENPDDLEE